MRPGRRLGALTAVAIAAMALLAPRAVADHTQLSTFQDDQYLIDSGTPVVERTLAVLEGVGAQVIRVNLQWATVAPDPQSRTVPAGFNGADPADYPASGWAPYDRLAELAPLYGLRVEFNLTSPGPLWAMGAHPPTARAATHWYPDAFDFFGFAYAAGRRYSGSYAGLPRVSTWSIWNEPNQPGWLAPQWTKVGRREVAESPRLYRSLAGAAYAGLKLSGHARDTILIGETAPEGYDAGGFYTAMTPVPFVRDLYCLDGRGQALRGPAAAALGCPVRGPARKFATANPALFRATGYAHHPYFFFHAPSVSATDPNFVPVADVGRLERLLDGAFRAYGVRGSLPVYFTEYGYQTNPPDPYQVVTPAQQAIYLNQADYMAWRDRRVRSVAQYLLYDAAPDPAFRPSQFDYWDTFQTGLLYASGAPKPAFFAYRMPIWVPAPRVRRGGGRVFVWGQVRPADRLGAQSVQVQWRPDGGSYRTIAAARTTAGTGYLTARVPVPGPGEIRLAWRSPSGAAMASRTVAVTAG